MGVLPKHPANTQVRIIGILAHRLIECPLDPYHTYLSLAALSMYSPATQIIDNNAASWQLEPLDPLLNAREETARWAREHIPARRS